ncbi:MAG: lactate racemase domain-containing protein [bacterium]|nr:lactate racemase domain-containing protein [bacterium]
MLEFSRTAPAGEVLSAADLQAALAHTLSGKLTGARVLILIPDHTRTMPLPLLFPMLVELLADVRQLDFMVALGTHPPLSEAALCALVGITPEAHRTTYAHIGLLNHAWDRPDALTQIGMITQDELRLLAGDCWHESLGSDVPIRINRAALEYDHILILGPTFPHEVAGYSGGAKYLFPGISGAAFINVSHWLGALITVRDTIGIADTPVRAMIHRAASFVSTPITLAALVVEHDGVSGIFMGDHVSAWRAAAAHSAQRHVIWVDRPFQQALSVAPPMYDELWVAAKAMYKLDPAIADDGEVIVYAPHLDTVSAVHGANIFRIGYHPRDYFLKQWERFADVPLGVIAHSTHLRGSGTFDAAGEHPRIRVTLASQISRADCERLSLGYRDPASIRVEEWQGREAEGVLYVPKAGEMLYRVR